MKKLMLAFALVVVTASVHAAAAKFNWGITSGQSLDASLNGQTLYLVLDSGANGFDTSILSSLSTFTVDNVFSGGDYQFTSLQLAGAGADRVTGWVFDPTVNGYPSTGTGQSFYAVVISDDGSSVYYSSAKTGNVNATTTVPTTLYFNSDSFTKFDVVPEPTAVALLAIGAAVLGLRRKVRA